MPKRKGVDVFRDSKYEILSSFKKSLDIELMHIPIDKRRVEYLKMRVQSLEQAIKKYNDKPSVLLTNEEEERLLDIRKKVKKREQLSKKDIEFLRLKAADYKLPIS